MDPEEFGSSLNMNGVLRHNVLPFQEIYVDCIPRSPRPLCTIRELVI